MFCPECGAEIPEGALKCSGCGAPLVGVIDADSAEFEEKQDEESPEKIGPAPDSDEEGYEEVLSTMNAEDVALIIGVLEGEEIDYYFKGEESAFVGVLTQPARLLVSKDQLEEAKELIGTLELTYTGLNYGIEEEKDEQYE